jgi:hypothetical protein
MVVAVVSCLAIGAVDAANFADLQILFTGD